MSTALAFPAAEFTGVTSAERHKWLDLRRTMLTASRTAALFGEHPFATPLDLYVEMVMGRPLDEVILIESPMFWGLALESAILESAARYYGWKHVPGGELLRSRKHPHLGATLDGGVDLGAGWGVYEGKTTSAWRAKDWDEQTCKAPTHVVIQAQHQMLVTGADWAIVFCLIGGQKPVKVELEADREFHGAIVEESEQFMASVRDLIPPKPTGKESDTNALKRLYSREGGSTVALPEEATEWTRQYQEITAQLALLKRRQRHYKQLIMHQLGKATYGVLPQPVGGKSVWRWDERAVVALKEHPAGPMRPACLPAANDTLVAQLEESIERETSPNVIRIGHGRRRARR
jgi:putative phage-type endonuclease